MKIVYSSFRSPYKKTKTHIEDEERALKRLAIRQERDRAKAIQDFPNEVAEIREYYPGWMPGDNIPTSEQQ